MHKLAHQPFSVEASRLFSLFVLRAYVSSLRIVMMFEVICMSTYWVFHFLRPAVLCAMPTLEIAQYKEAVKRETDCRKTAFQTRQGERQSRSIIELTCHKV